MIGKVMRRGLFVGDFIPTGFKIPVITLTDNGIESHPLDCFDAMKNSLVVSHLGVHTIHSTERQLPEFRENLQALR
jgi:peroxiredoxin